MKTARQLLAICLGFALLASAQGNSFDKIRYHGGTVLTTTKPKDWGNKLIVSSDKIRLLLKDGQVLEIDSASVYRLAYGQHRIKTVAVVGIFIPLPLLGGWFHKGRRHYVRIRYTDADGNTRGLLLQAHKKNYKRVLLALRRATGAPLSVSQADRKYLPPGVEATATKETEEVGQAESGPAVINVSSIPESAEVWVNGAFVGNTPAKLTLAAGKYKIRVSLQGYQDWEREIQIFPDSELTLRATLQKP